MLIDNVCFFCSANVARNGHAADCALILSEYEANDRLSLFRQGQYRPVRQGRTWSPLKTADTRRKNLRSQVRVNKLTKSGEIDKRRKWRVA